MALRDLAALLNGPQTIGRGAGFWSSAMLVVVLAAIYPLYAEPFAVANTAYFGVWVFMALGLGLLWGYGGMLSFGQTAFFGLAGYAYGVMAINLGAAHSYPLLALICALAIGTAFAALLGYFMIYGGINGVFVGIVTLSVTLAFATFMNQTAGPEWRIGRARLNGYNGMTRIPSLSIDWFDGHRIKFDGANFYYLVLGLLCSDLPGAARVGEFPFWQRSGRQPGKSGTCRTSWLRRSAAISLRHSRSAVSWPLSAAPFMPPGATSSCPLRWLCRPRQCRSSGLRSVAGRM